MLEQQLIRHCSPTLANLKAASLLCVAEYEGFEQEFERYSRLLSSKGLRLVVLHHIHDRILLYLYRERSLAGILSREDIQCFLTGYGYNDFSIEGTLTTLAERILSNRSGDFPHEIGIFLDYPLADVVAFIVNKGKNCLCCGCWKAYSDECGAMKTFARYNKCKEVYLRMFAAGVPMQRLTVRS